MNLFFGAGGKHPARNTSMPGECHNPWGALHSSVGCLSAWMKLMFHGLTVKSCELTGPLLPIYVFLYLDHVLIVFVGLGVRHLHIPLKINKNCKNFQGWKFDRVFLVTCAKWSSYWPSQNDRNAHVHES